MVSLSGFVVALIWILGIYSLLNPGFSFTYLGPSLPYAVSVTIVFVLIGLAIYDGARAYHRRRDRIDISSVYKEIPPE